MSYTNLIATLTERQPPPRPAAEGPPPRADVSSTAEGAPSVVSTDVPVRTSPGDLSALLTVVRRAASDTAPGPALIDLSAEGVRDAVLRPGPTGWCVIVGSPVSTVDVVRDEASYALLPVTHQRVSVVFDEAHVTSATALSLLRDLARAGQSAGR